MMKESHSFFFFYCLWVEVIQLPPINIFVLADNKKGHTMDNPLNSHIIPVSNHDSK